MGGADQRRPFPLRHECQKEIERLHLPLFGLAIVVGLGPPFSAGPVWGLKLVEAENQSEEAEWILAQARGLGVEVARRTLADWHIEGLIPAPKHVGLGQGHGSKSVYPAGTLSQLIACHT